jgi:hypothetical protein
MRRGVSPFPHRTIFPRYTLMSQHITKGTIVTSLSTGFLFIVKHAGKYTADCVRSTRNDAKMHVIPFGGLRGIHAEASGVSGRRVSNIGSRQVVGRHEA